MRFDIIRDNEADLERLFEMKSQNSDVYWSGYTTAPDKKKFAEWYNEQLKRSDRKIWLVREMQNSEITVGYLYLTFENQSVYLSHGVKEEYAGKSIGSAIINYATNICLTFYPEYNIESWIIEPNVASVNTFLKNSFRKTELVKETFYASFQKNLVMHNYSFHKG
ncbi:MAG: GNAT family N-acetyltransferase [Bacteroidota bacterium]